MLPSPDSILDHLQRTKTNIMITIPAMLHVWAQSEAAVDYFKTFINVVSSLLAGSPNQNLIALRNVKVFLWWSNFKASRK